MYSSHCIMRMLLVGLQEQISPKRVVTQTQNLGDSTGPSTPPETSGTISR